MEGIGSWLINSVINCYLALFLACVFCSALLLDLIMQSLQRSSNLQYRITTIKEGILLSIWEPAGLTDERVKPFLYMVNHKLQSQIEAQMILRDYLTATE